MSNDKVRASRNALIEFATPIASKISEGFERTKTLFSSPCIFRVPKDLHKLNESAYVPSLIVIGPLHCKDEHLQTSMQHVKTHYTNILLGRLAECDNQEMIELKKGKVLLNCLEEMMECVERAMKCYAEEVPLVEKGTVGKKEGKEMVEKEVEKKTEEAEKEMVKKEVEKKTEEAEKETEEAEKEMVEMMLVDGCFILNLLYSSYLWKKKNIPPGGDGGNPKASSRSPLPTHGGEDGNKSSSDNGGMKDPLLENDSLLPQNQLCQASSSSPQPTHGGEDGSKSNSDGDGMVDPILDCLITESIVKHDLLLLENQIPFFVLENLYKHTVKEIPLDPIIGEKIPSLTDLVLDYFEDIMFLDGDNSEGKNDKSSSLSDCVLWVNESCFSKGTESGEEQPRKENGYHHILHFLHKLYIGNIPQPWKESTSNWREVSASDLDYAGVQFVPIKGNLFDVQFIKPKGPFCQFRSAWFQIPTLVIDDLTETLFRNLIALEQCCPNVQLCFTSYAKFIDMLIDSERDVKVLTEANVVRNHLGADVDVSDLVNKLCKQIVTPKNFYFNDACEAAYHYSQRRWPRFGAYVRRTYIDSPWRSLGFLVAIIAFVITVVEFILELT